MLNIGFVNIIYKIFIFVVIFTVFILHLNYSYSYLKIIRLFNQKVSKVSKFIINTQEIFNQTQNIVDLEYEDTKIKLDYKNDKNLQYLNNKTFSLNNNSIVFSNKGVTLFTFKKILENKMFN